MSAETTRNALRRRGRRLYTAIVMLLAAIAAGVLLFAVVVRWRVEEWQLSPLWPETPAAEAPNEPSFSGTSEQLRQTVFVPTLEARLEDGKSAVWCGTVQLGWHQLEKDITHGPLELNG